MLNCNGIKHNFAPGYFVNKLERIIVKTCKYDGKPHRSWRAEILEQTEKSLVLLGVFDTPVEHSQLGTIQAGTLSYEYYWFDRWYNVFRFHEPDGALRNFYCNVNMPPKLEGDVLSYVDLDIDIFVSKDFEIAIWDVDEFEENAVRYKYPSEVMRKAQETVGEVTHLIEARLFPFEEGA
jgi:protein associated with RNAse G/E